MHLHTGAETHAWTSDELNQLPTELPQAYAALFAAGFAKLSPAERSEVKSLLQVGTAGGQDRCGRVCAVLVGAWGVEAWSVGDGPWQHAPGGDCVVGQGPAASPEGRSTWCVV